MNLGQLQLRLKLERRQDCRKRLPASSFLSRCPIQQDVVRTGAGHFQARLVACCADLSKSLVVIAVLQNCRWINSKGVGGLSIRKAAISFTLTANPSPINFTPATTAPPGILFAPGRAQSGFSARRQSAGALDARTLHRAKARRPPP